MLAHRGHGEWWSVGPGGSGMAGWAWGGGIPVDRTGRLRGGMRMVPAPTPPAGRPPEAAPPPLQRPAGTCPDLWGHHKWDPAVAGGVWAGGGTQA